MEENTKIVEKAVEIPEKLKNYLLKFDFLFSRYTDNAAFLIDRAIVDEEVGVDWEKVRSLEDKAAQAFCDELDGFFGVTATLIGDEYAGLPSVKMEPYEHKYLTYIPKEDS